MSAMPPAPHGGTGAKASPGKASVGIPGVGSTGHLAGIAFQKETGTTFQVVPYRGNAQALQDLVAGRLT